MNLCVMLHHCKPESNGTIRVGYGVETDAGHELGSEAIVNFDDSSVQMNNAIEAAAKRAIADTFGLALGAQDKVRIFGGAVL